MKPTVIDCTVNNNLCVSCGICASVCPQNCITFDFHNGQYIPSIGSQCTRCGRCSDICSLHKDEYAGYFETNGQNPTDNLYIGHYISCFNAYAKDETTRANSTSGGCITAIIQVLLGIYKTAFLVDDFNYEKLVETKPYQKGEALVDTAKSRYIPVSHRNMVKYILQHPDEKVIIIATSCVIHTFLNVINMYQLNRTNYLLLGLFCDKTLNYNIFTYFRDYNKDGELAKLFFRTKEQTGWPGNVKLEYINGKSVFLPASERTMVKDFFQIERCMYCIDKLNIFADISFGDNYTGQDAGKKGSNTIICRTQKGREILALAEPYVQLTDTSMDHIISSQKLEARKLNFEHAKIFLAKKGINIYPGILTNTDSIGIIKEYKEKISRINIGRAYPKGKKKILRIVKKKRKRIHRA